MSSYIIAGSADSLDTAYCEEIARRIKAKYKNIDFRIVIKHASEWEDYLQEICRIYGFLKKSNPIVYTFDGKIIGGKENFLLTATKYFGLDEEQLIVEDLTSKINIKLADEELRLKKIQKSNTKTLQQKIDIKYKELLSKGILKYAPKQKEIYLVNGIQYIHLELPGLVQPMKFIKEKQIPVINEEIQPEEINLVSLSLQDQIKPEETIAKEAFVTSNQKAQASEHDRLSEASKSKMHESIVSYDKQSKGVKESGKAKLKIDQQNDDVPDYIDYPMKETIVCQLADQFFVAFDPKSVIGQEMMFYYNVDSSGNSIRMHNDGRPIKGHRVIIREVHYEVNEKDNLLPEIPIAQAEDIEQPIEGEGQIQVQTLTPQPIKETVREQQHFRQRKLTLEIEKSKTEPNIPVPQSQQNLKVEDILSEPNEELNLISHLNHHTLFIHKPLSLLQLKNLIYFVKETDTIATLQFLPQNPNPRVKLHVRKLLVKDQESCKFLPVERFISKQLEDKQYRQLTLPSENSEGLMDESGETFKTIQINGMGFKHIIYQLNGESQEKINKIIKFSIDHFLSIEEEVQRDIGYNLIITKKHIIVVPIVQAYQVYNGSKLYLDGLAFLGYVHTAKLAKPYQIQQPTSSQQDEGKKVRTFLSVQTGFREEE